MYVRRYVCVHECICKCLGPNLVACCPRCLTPAGPDPSEPSSSSDDSSSDSSIYSENTRLERARARVRRHAWQQEHGPGNRRLWFRRRLVLLLCEIVLEQQLHGEDRSAWQVSGQLQALCRRCQGIPAEGLVEMARARLSILRVNSLSQDTPFILRMVDRPIPPNDLCPSAFCAHVCHLCCQWIL